MTHVKLVVLWQLIPLLQHLTGIQLLCINKDWIIKSVENGVYLCPDNLKFCHLQQLVDIWCFLPPSFHHRNCSWRKFSHLLLHYYHQSRELDFHLYFDITYQIYCPSWTLQLLAPKPFYILMWVWPSPLNNHTYNEKQLAPTNIRINC